MKPITHLFIYQTEKDGVFDNVNSYKELNETIKNYGKEQSKLQKEIEELKKGVYNNTTGDLFEIYTLFFSNRYGETPLLNIKNVKDTSDDPFTAGYDFTFTSLSDKPGQIQSKWRSNPAKQFKLNDLATNDSIAAACDIEKNDNILFTNLDDTENLFHFSYEYARKKRRVIGRNAQEEFILRDPKFWDDFRECIKESAKTEFQDPWTPREQQNWILNGTVKDGVTYEGTESVVHGKYTKGRVEATTAAGKTLCQFYDLIRSFENDDKLNVMILPTISLISQTFQEFYKWKMFGYKDDEGNKVDTGISCVIIRSGSMPRYNNQLVNVLQSLEIKDIVNFIETETKNDRKVLMFTTMASHTLKYSDIVGKLKEKGIKIGIEIVDEYHNVISTSSVREKQEEIAEYLENNTSRCNGTIFYSASNKDGQILSSFNEEQFGPLLCKVNRNELRIRGIVTPKLLFKVIRVNEKSNSVELKRDATRINLDIDKAQVEAVGIIKAQKDIQKYYDEPNLITFGSHVAGCYFIKESKQMSKYLPGVKNYVMSAETKNSERDSIIDEVKDSGNNILHQHSVAKEGINIPNLHGGVIGRGMSITTTQQAIGRSDRALNEDTIKFEKGELSLDNPTGWKKYYNIIYLIVDSSSEMLIDRFKEIVKYLLDSGIPEDQWDISVVEDDERTDAENDDPDFFPEITNTVEFDKDKIKKMIEDAKIQIFNDIDKFENKKIFSEMSTLDSTLEKAMYIFDNIDED